MLYKISPVNRFCIKALKFYKTFISVPLKAGCIFTPSCSVYSMEAFIKHNFFAAVGLTIWRILRCNRINKGGFDPVPENPNYKKWLM